MTSKEKERKYALTDETQEVAGHTLHRIVAVRRFGCVKKGEKGGWIEKESNLSHEGLCWIFGDAAVFGDATLSENAAISGWVSVHDDARVYGCARLFDGVKVCSDARVYDSATLHDKAVVFHNAEVYGNAEVCYSAEVYGNAKVYDNAKVCATAEVYDNAKVCGSALICEAAKVCGDAEVSGEAVVRGFAVVSSDEDYIVFKNWWSSGRHFTWTRSNNMWRVGCFYGTGDELIRKAYEDSKRSGREYERIVKYVEGILKAEEE